jgi:hypothetical protein
MSEARAGVVGVGVPDTLAGRDLAEYLDAFNTGECEVMSVRELPGPRGRWPVTPGARPAYSE